ncbi:hypothetical protein H2198_007350 [Neophaeococcomyces mojaviensis]|uniref:Uncharacterized protein n=1 Tax=Neophaeococcomyces mojaviensis TaxID=3383035 RepID=A0ACC3A067_9EURO|nr:hypothetical protein H2198_007350 [Knufia sp. JES_112]
MPSLPKFNWRNKKDRQSLPPSTQPQTLGHFRQPSTSTINTSVGTASSSWNSQISLPSNPPGHRRYVLEHVPEHPDDIRIPAELEDQINQHQWSPPAPQFSPPAPQFSSPPSQFSLLPPPQYERFHHTQQQDTRGRVHQDVEADIIANTREKDIAAAQENELERERNASAENVRRLRELIRQKYALDLYVWQKRNVAKANRKKILPKCEEADRIYQEIIWIVNAWSEHQFDAEEWMMVRKIQTALLCKQLPNGESNEPAYWDNLKPWERRDDSMGG